MRYLKIRNRLNTHQERAKDLTVWVSGDEKSWKQVWRARSVKDEWVVDAGKDVTCSYIKIGLPRKGTLHLNKVTVFGK